MVGLLSDETFCTDLEAYETSGLVGPFQGFLAGLAHREYRAGPVRPAAERAEDVARLAVDANVLDAFDGACFVGALNLLEHAFGWDEEAYDAAADLRRRLQRR
jgi:hypothetical protein